MTKVPKYWDKAKKYLSKKDRIMYKLIKSYQSPSEIILTSRRDVFFSLCKSIIGQQISVAAANSVFLKFKKKCNHKINAKNVSKLSNSYPFFIRYEVAFSHRIPPVQNIAICFGRLLSGSVSSSVFTQSGKSRND